MPLLRPLGGIIFVFAPVCFWACILLAAKLMEVGLPGCSFSGAGSIGCGPLGHWLYDMALLFAFFGIIAQVIWLIPAALITGIFLCR